MSDEVGLVWLRRDLRLSDNPALAEASRRHERVLLCFCFERGLTRGRHACPARNAYLLVALTELERELRELGGKITFHDGDPARELPSLAQEIGAKTIHANEDHTAYARRRDRRVGEALGEDGIRLVMHSGIACTDVSAIATNSGEPFRAFEPFFRAWRAAPRRSPELRPRLHRAPEQTPASRLPSESQLSVDSDAKRIANIAQPGERASLDRLDSYFKRINTFDEARDRPDLDWTSRISAALHFGCISARAMEERLAARPGRGRSQLRRQLARRDFFLHIAHHFPDTLGSGHEPRMRGFRWRHDRNTLETWQRGQTGLPLIDAGMRQLLSEGWMHNRLRMLAASFLTKHLLCDWREGEAHFMQHLIDGDEASNNGNWQSAASLGTEAEPYFPAFNPARLHQRFDPDGIYVRRWIPELADFPDEHIAEPWKALPKEQRTARCVIGTDYPSPVVDLVTARQEAMARFRTHLSRAG